MSGVRLVALRRFQCPLDQNLPTEVCRTDVRATVGDEPQMLGAIEQVGACGDGLKGLLPRR